jgi:hypothetical protein
MRFRAQPRDISADQPQFLRLLEKRGVTAWNVIYVVLTLPWAKVWQVPEENLIIVVVMPAWWQELQCS